MCGFLLKPDRCLVPPHSKLSFSLCGRLSFLCGAIRHNRKPMEEKRKEKRTDILARPSNIFRDVKNKLKEGN